MTKTEPCMTLAILTSTFIQHSCWIFHVGNPFKDPQLSETHRHLLPSDVSPPPRSDVSPPPTRFFQVAHPVPWGAWEVAHRRKRRSSPPPCCNKRCPLRETHRRKGGARESWATSDDDDDDDDWAGWWLVKVERAPWPFLFFGWEFDDLLTANQQRHRCGVCCFFQTVVASPFFVDDFKN